MLDTCSRFWVAAVICVCLYSSITLFPETLRDRATQRFNLIQWTLNSDFVPPVEIPGTNVAGGDESYALLNDMAGKPLPALYPEVERLGKLDYSGLDPQLVELLFKVARQLGTQNIDPSVCDPSRPFLGPIASFQLMKIPKAEAVLLSRPVQSDDMRFSSVFRLQIRSDKKPIFVYLFIQTLKVKDTWYVNEITFDGESYADLSQPH